jgi:CSLREA domain-containing protein
MMSVLFQKLKTMLILLILLAATIGSIIHVQHVSAAVIVVNTNADNTIAGDGFCTLREAINNANSTTGDTTDGDCVAGVIGPDTISLPTGTYTLTSGSKLPFINSNITIIGVDAETTIIEASDCNPVDEDTCTHNHRVFDVFSAGQLTLEEVTVRHGFGSVDGDGSIDGGGIRNQGNLTISKSIISDNKATYGGGIWNFGTGIVTLTDSFLRNNEATSSGGGIWNANVVTLTGTTLSHNDAVSAGGGLFTTADGTVSISSGTIEFNEANNGGGILNYGALTIANHATLSDNKAQTSGGGIFNGGSGTVTLTDSELKTNIALSQGGGLYSSGGQVSIVDSDLTGNTAGSGAGISNTAEMNLTGGIISGNIADSSGGGIMNFGDLEVVYGTISGNMANSGGGINSFGNLSITNTLLSGNEVDQNGGAILNSSGTLTLTKVEILDNTSNYGGGIYHNSSQAMTLVDNIISKNIANQQGGGVYCGSASKDTVNTIENSNFLENVSVNYGGGIYNFGNLNVINSHFETNTATNHSGGGIYTYGDDASTRIEQSTFIKNAAFNGGGIMNHSNLEIVDSSFIENTALGTSGYGGGINNQKSLQISNSTLSGNLAAYGGGAVLNSINGSMLMINCTLSGNSANNGGGLHNVGSLDFANTIIANSVSVSDCWNDGGTITTNTHNLVMDGTCSPDVSGDPLLHPLGDNGGPTLTHTLLAGSPAIDTGDLDECPATDQRGMPRPQGAGCDIGAFEVQPISVSFTGSPTNGVAPLPVTFIFDVTGDYDTCTWDFSDGATSDECGDTMHIYTTAGVYSVSLTISGPGGTDTMMKTDYLTVYQPVVANFSGDPISGPVPLQVTFTNLSTGDYDTCSWTFGDGGNSTVCANPSHVYNTPGVYAVALTVSGPGGSDSRTWNNYITVQGEPPVGYSIFLPLILR